MGPELQIAINTAQELKVVNPVQFFWWPVYLGILGEIVLPSLVLATLPGSMPAATRARLRLIFIGTSIAGFLMLAIFLGWRHTLDIHWDSGQATATDQFWGAQVSEKTFPTSSVQKATIQYARQGRRIALVMKDGGIMTPLGTGYISKQLQYVVAESINAGLHSGGAASDIPSRTPGGTTQQDKTYGSPGFDQMMEQQKAFERKLEQEKKQGPNQ